MAKKLHILEVRGKSHSWIFPVYVDPQYLDDWREDGLEINVVENTVPEWVASLGLSHVWCFIQDLFHFKNPLAK